MPTNISVWLINHKIASKINTVFIFSIYLLQIEMQVIQKSSLYTFNWPLYPLIFFDLRMLNLKGSKFFSQLLLFEMCFSQYLKVEFQTLSPSKWDLIWRQAVLDSSGFHNKLQIRYPKQETFISHNFGHQGVTRFCGSGVW